MSADVLAAARGTLRDLDAALAAQEASAAVAWLDARFDLAWDHLMITGCSDHEEGWCEVRDPDLRYYLTSISSGTNEARPIVDVLDLPSDDEMGRDLASWPLPAFRCDIRTQEQRAADDAEAFTAARGRRGYVVVRHEGEEPLVYPMADVRVSHAPARWSLPSLDFTYSGDGALTLTVRPDLTGFGSACVVDHTHDCTTHPPTTQERHP